MSVQPSFQLLAELRYRLKVTCSIVHSHGLCIRSLSLVCVCVRTCQLSIFGRYVLWCTRFERTGV